MSIIAIARPFIVYLAAVVLAQGGEASGIQHTIRPLIKSPSEQPLLALGLSGGKYSQPLTEAEVVERAAQAGTPLDAIPEGAVVQFNAFVKAADIPHLRAMCHDDSDRAFIATAIEPRIDQLAAARSTATLILHGRVNLGGGTLISGGLLPNGTDRLIPTMPVFVISGASGHRISFALALDGSLMQLLSLTGRFDTPVTVEDVSGLRRIELTTSSDFATLVPGGADSPLTLYHTIAAYPQAIDITTYEGTDPQLQFMQIVHAAFRDGAKDVIDSTLDKTGSVMPATDDKFGWEANRTKAVVAVGKQVFPEVTAIFFRNGTSPKLRTFWVRLVDGALQCSSMYPFASQTPELVSLYARPDWMAIVSACLTAH